MISKSDVVLLLTELQNSGEDVSRYVAIGFRAKKSNGKYRYYWLYRY